jgi:putative transposase
VTWQRTPLFRQPRAAELMMVVLHHYLEQEKYFLHEFVIMPDHLHLLLTPAAEVSLERAMQLVKGGFSFRIKKKKRGASGRRASRIIDSAMRKISSITQGYIRMNPVRASSGPAGVAIRTRRLRNARPQRAV